MDNATAAVMYRAKSALLIAKDAISHAVKHLCEIPMPGVPESQRQFVPVSGNLAATVQQIRELESQLDTQVMELTAIVKRLEDGEQEQGAAD
jgi:hypothetical protein